MMKNPIHLLEPRQRMVTQSLPMTSRSVSARRRQYVTRRSLYSGPSTVDPEQSRSRPPEDPGWWPAELKTKSTSRDLLRVPTQGEVPGMAAKAGQHKAPRQERDGEGKKKREHGRTRTTQKQHTGRGSSEKQMSGPRGGREAVVERILDAAEQLFSLRGFAGTSMRDVAAAAGVSHALAHRYVGSKADLLAAVFRRREHLLVEAADSADDLREAVITMMSAGQLTRQHMRLVARSALEGVPYRSSYEDFPATQKLVELAKRKAAGVAAGDEDDPDRYLDPRLVVAGTIVLGLGWAAIEPWIVKATRLDSWSREELDAGVLSLMLRVAETPVAFASADRAEDPIASST
jgi:AcrR family transcriptional regulator